MQLDRQTLRFFAAFIVIATVLGYAMWRAGTGSGGLGFDTGMVAAPAASAMLAAVGFSWRRKLAYSVVTLGLYFGTGALANASGLLSQAQDQMAGTGAFPSVVSLLYVSWLLALPFVMLILFVGRRPSLLWSRDA